MLKINAVLRLPLYSSGQYEIHLIRLASCQIKPRQRATRAIAITFPVPGRHVQSGPMTKASTSAQAPRPHTVHNGHSNISLTFVSFQNIKLGSSPERQQWAVRNHGSAPMYHAVPFCPYEHQSNETIPPFHQNSSFPLPYFIVPNQKCIYFFFWPCSCSFRTFLTIFCSSIRKARTMRSRTQPPHREPP